MPIRHRFTSPRSDDGIADIVQPSNWNDTHDLGEGLVAQLDALAASPNLVLYINGSSVLATISFAGLLSTVGAAPLADPVFTGNPRAPTQSSSDNDTSIATTAFVKTAIANLINAAPTALDTLKELSDALGGDANFSTTVTASLGNRLRFDAAQTLSGPQKTQAQTNIGLVPGTSANNVVQLDGSAKLPAVDGSQLTNLSVGAGTLPIRGLLKSTAGSSSSFTVAVGAASDSTGATLMTLASAITKTTGAWAVGTGNGGLDTGTIANNTWYHAHLIKQTSGGGVDVLVSLSPSAPTMPGGYSYSRYIGAMKTNGSAQWTAFNEYGTGAERVCRLATAVTDVVEAASTSTSAVLRTVSTPLGVQTEAMVTIHILNTSGSEDLIVTCPDAVNVAVTGPDDSMITVGANIRGFLQLEIFTNTSSQIRTRQSTGTGSVFGMKTRGWRYFL